MNEAIAARAKRKSVAEYKAIVQQQLDEMARIEERMDRDAATSARLKAEAQSISDETQAIMARTSARLLELQIMVDRLTGAK